MQLTITLIKVSKRRDVLTAGQAQEIRNALLDL